MSERTDLRTNLRFLAFSICLGLFGGRGLPAQEPAGAGPALETVRAAVQAELAAAENDHSRWRYRDEEKDKSDSVSIVVQTDAGSVKRLIAKGGRPLSQAEARLEEQRVQSFASDVSKQAKQRRDGASDDREAKQLLEMLPVAFVWKVTRDDGDTVRLHFEPDPKFQPPTMQARVLSAMNGELVVDKRQHRIETISGRLTRDVTFGFGLLGRMQAGGTFRVERRQLAPGLWQITETHVHIDGKALLFKSISQNEDEVQTEFKPVPAGTTLEQAAKMSREK